LDRYRNGRRAGGVAEGEHNPLSSRDPAREANPNSARGPALRQRDRAGRSWGRLRVGCPAAGDSPHWSPSCHADQRDRPADADEENVADAEVRRTRRHRGKRVCGTRLVVAAHGDREGPNETSIPVDREPNRCGRRVLRGSRSKEHRNNDGHRHQRRSDYRHSLHVVDRRQRGSGLLSAHGMHRSYDRTPGPSRSQGKNRAPDKRTLERSGGTPR